MSDHPPEQGAASPDEQPFFAPPPGYGEQPQVAYPPPPQPYGQYPIQPPPYGPQPPPYYQPGPPGGKSHHTRYIILGVIGALVLIGGIGAVFGLLIGGKATPAASATSKPPAASVSGAAGSLGVNTWYTKYVQPAVHKLSADINRVSTDAGNNNGAALLADCQQMLTDVQAAQADPTVSDPTIAADWAKVLGDFSAGARDCVRAVSNGGGSLVDRARAEILQGNTDAGKLVSDLEKLANGG